jgi:hypothetical protein
VKLRQSIEARKAEMADVEAVTTDSAKPIQSQSARFRKDEAGRDQGILLLYPDKLVAVESWAEIWGTVPN